MAGLRTLAELRGQGYDGRLTWIGAEGLPAYDRPPLSKELLARTEPVWLAEDLAIDAGLADAVELARPATGLQVGDGVLVVETVDGDLSADAVVVATGSEPLAPWPGVPALHSAADAEGLRERIGADGGRHLVIVGAGWIGAEVAGVAAAAGHQVTVLEAGPEPLWRQLGERAGGRTRRWYADAGVDLRTGVLVAQADHRRVVLADETVIDGDLVLAAIGVRPATSWLGGSVPRLASGHLPTTRGGRTRLPGLWAVGDVAARETPLLGVVPGGHWFAALRDPALLAAEMLGHPLPPTEPAPEVFSDQLGHHLEVIGRLVRQDEPGAAHVLRELSGGWVELHLHSDVLVGAVIADAPREVSAVRKLLRGEALPRLDVVAAADAATALPRAVRA